MSEPARSQPAPSERPRYRLPEGILSSDDLVRVDEPLPEWVAEAHLRYLQTGEGDPWGGYSE
ncbi:MAG: hypothetical protein SFV15_15915 [Polyangiaceae bacterium]|nr:hypothetical protein [Polyangiaceae bacterium]